MRSKGEGSLTWNASRQRWMVAVSFRTRRIYRYVPGAPPPKDPPKAAERALSELLAARDREAPPPDPRMTVEAWCRTWIGDIGHARRRLRPATLRYYAMIVEEHIIPSLGGFRLGALRRRDVQRWLDDMTAAPRTVQHRRDVLRLALNVAIADGIVTVNVAAGAEVPEFDGGAPTVLTAEQARTLILGTASDWYGAVWALALGSHMRSAELRGLIWEDVDWSRGGIAVRRQLVREGGAWGRGPLKRSRAHEFLALPDFAMAALRRHRKRMAKARRTDWRWSGHVVLTPTGEPPYDWHLLAALTEASARLKLPRVTVHQLRHTSLTLAEEGGMGREDRMRRAGHSTVKMADHYAHGTDQLDRRAADLLGKIIGA
jgi:integrase